MPGERLDDRFEVGRPVGSGAMGTVFHAYDHLLEQEVAIKVLHALSGNNVERFHMEANVLAALSHPRIVRYIAHGQTEKREPYLAMEWLSGSTLEDRLRRSRLTMGETVLLFSKVAEGLADAHRLGIVHRDIKPANLFLVGDAVESVKLTDFGVARRLQDEWRLTQTGMLIGTPVYMSPEQARGERVLDAAIDTWALGCVLYECLSGSPPFQGESLMAILAKIVVESPAPLRASSPTVLPELAMLLEQMLLKDSSLRPNLAYLQPKFAKVAQQLQTMGSYATIAPQAPFAASSRGSSTAFGARREQRVVCLVVVGPYPPLPLDTQLREVLAGHHGSVETVLDGSHIVTWSVPLPPREEVQRAARCARALQGLFDDRAVVLCTGRAVIDGSVLLGEVLERAFRLVSDTTPGVIRVDDSSGALLDGRFEVRGEPGHLLLFAERSEHDAPRTLLGKVTSCFGRDRDLDTLVHTFHDCTEDETARAMLLIGPSGIGKTRVTYEFLRRLRSGGDSLRLLSGRGDSMRVAAPFGMLSLALRQLASIEPDDQLEESRCKLRETIECSVGHDMTAAVLPFLGEICAVPYDEEEFPELRAARKDARLMADRMRLAWLDWLQAECQQAPVFILLEDLQWGDVPTVQFVDSALRALQECRLFVMAVARPEVFDAFPNLWRDRSVSTMRLSSLPKKAAHLLVEQVLGSGLPTGMYRSIVDRADGNALFLEELIRSVSTDATAGDLPDTVLGMVQARLDALGDEAKQVSAAGSVFGQSFQKEGVCSLLAGVRSPSSVQDWLSFLIDREIVFTRGGSDSFTFRHALIRDSAYELLTPADRSEAHRSAAFFLCTRTDVAAIVVAEHFERGGSTLAAAGWYRKAAEHALSGDDLASVIACADKAVACGAEGVVLGELAWFKAEAHQWRVEDDACARCSETARAWLPPGDGLWFRSSATLLMAHTRQGRHEQAEDVAREMLVHAQGACFDGQTVVGLATAVFYLAPNYSPLADIILSLLTSRAEAEPVDPIASGWIWLAKATAANSRADAYSVYACSERAYELFKSAGEIRGYCATLGSLGSGLTDLGVGDRGLAIAQELRALGERMGLGECLVGAAVTGALALYLLGEVERARSELTSLLAEGTGLNGSSRGFVEAHRALYSLELGDLEQADLFSRSAITCYQEWGAGPAAMARVNATRARVLLEHARWEEAYALSRKAHEALAESAVEGEMLVRLVYIQTLFALGRNEEAQDALRSASLRLEERAAAILDPEIAHSFLERVTENAEIRRLTLRPPVEKGVTPVKLGHGSA